MDLTNVTEITLNGIRITNWSISGSGSASNWSEYPATQTVNMANNDICKSKVLNWVVLVELFGLLL